MGKLSHPLLPPPLAMKQINKTMRTRLIYTYLLAAGLLTLPAFVQAQDYIYETNNGAITIIGYTGSGGDVTIPATINGLPVTAIGNGAFNGSALTSVTIPDSVTSIGNDTFSWCEYLSSVSIPNSVTKIGNDLFYRCLSLKNVIIPSSVVGIGTNAFSECLSLRRIYFSGNAPDVDSSAFSGDYTTAYFLTNAPGWGSTLAGITTAVWDTNPPPPLFVSQSFPGEVTMSWEGNMVLIFSSSLDFNYPWFRSGDASPVTAPVLVVPRFSSVPLVGLDQQYFRLLDITDLGTDFFANVDLARDPYAPFPSGSERPRLVLPITLCPHRSAHWGRMLMFKRL